MKGARVAGQTRQALQAEEAEEAERGNKKQRGCFSYFPYRVTDLA